MVYPKDKIQLFVSSDGLIIMETYIVGHMFKSTRPELWTAIELYETGWIPIESIECLEKSDIAWC